MKLLEVFNDFLLRYTDNKITEISSVVMDSRKVSKGDVFFAIGNGNKYVEEVLKEEVSLVIYDDESLNIKDNRGIKVKDTVVAMQEVARSYIRSLDITVIGITGTNGKTSTKDLVYSVLSKKYTGQKSQGNFNNQIGLPYTILQLREVDEIAVLEMGMSSFGEIDKLCDISNIDYGIITNIGESHLEYLETVENVFKAKGEMLKYLSKNKRILFGNDEYLSKVDGIKVGFGEKLQYRIEGIAESETGVTFEVNSHKYQIGLLGAYNAINASFAIALATELGLSYNEIEEGLREAKLSSMRCEIIEMNNSLYINDAYNADPMSMKEAINTFDNIYNDRYKIMVLGDMLELGLNSKDYHRNLSKYIENMKVDRVYLYGSEMKALADSFKRDYVEYRDSKDEIKNEIAKINNKKVILIKGSRGMKLEEIID